MAKLEWKPGNMLYPLPAVMVSVSDGKGKDNIITVGWTATVCTNPPMLTISVRKERFSHHMIEETGEFIVNLTTENLAYATDYCGVKSGRDVDKFKEMNLHKVPGKYVGVPMIEESPVCIECRVHNKMELGSHDMYVADVLAVHVDEKYMNESNKFELAKSNPIVYSHGEYYTIGKMIGTFGYSVKKQSKKTSRGKRK